MNTSCGDTVKCRLDAAKSPIFRSQSPCTYIYIYVQESQRFWDFVCIYTYERVKHDEEIHPIFLVKSRGALLIECGF